MASTVNDKFFDEKFGITDSVFPKLPHFDLGFRATSWMLRLDAGKSVHYSYNGIDIHGRLYKTDKFVVKDGVDAEKVWLKLPSVGDGPADVRVWGWIVQR